MLIHALITPIRTNPKPTILLVLDCLDEVLAHLIGRRPWVTMLAEHNAAQFLLVPVIHRIGLLLVLGIFDVARVGVKILLGRLTLNVQIVTEFALLALLTASLLVEHTQYGLRVHAEGDLLYLDGLKQLGSLLLCQLSGLLLGLALLFLGFFPLGFGVLVGFGHRLQLLDLFLGSTTFFLLVGLVMVVLEAG